MTDFFEVGGTGYVLLILVFAACMVGLLLLRAGKPKKQSRAEELQAQYAVLTADMLANTPEEQLVTAVVANLMGKLPRRHPDPLQTFPKLGRGRSAAYFVWLAMKEVEHNGTDALKSKRFVRFADVAVEGLKTVEAFETAAAVEAFLKNDGAPDAVEMAIAKENPLALTAEYIRLNAAEFVDE